MLGVFQRPLTLILLQKYRDTNGRRIVIQIGGVYTTFCQKEAYFCRSIAIEMGGVRRFFSEVSGSGVDFTLLNMTAPRTLVIRIAAITLASDSAIAIVRFRPSKVLKLLIPL